MNFCFFKRTVLHGTAVDAVSGRARIGSRRGRRCRVVIGLCAALAAGVARGDVTLPSLISDNMVLQERSNINVWGKADPGETVTVQMGPDSAQTSAGPDGNWGVKLDGLKSGGPYDLTVSGKNSVTVHNVAVGEVWVCAGESNMEMKVVAARNGQQEMANANVPMVRVFVVKHASAGSPQADCEGTWVVCDPDTVQDLTATGFFFARELNQEMRVPFGLIQSAWGPSRAAAWTPAATLEKDPSLTQVLDRYQAAAANYPAALAAYQAKLVAWKDAKTAGDGGQWAEAGGAAGPGGDASARGIVQCDDRAADTVCDSRSAMGPGRIGYGGPDALPEAVPSDDRGVAEGVGRGGFSVFLCAGGGIPGASCGAWGEPVGGAAGGAGDGAERAKDGDGGLDGYGRRVRDAPRG